MLLYGLIMKTESVTQSVIDGLMLCYTAVIPALFPFFVISGIMVNTGMIAALGNVFSPVAKILFRTSGKGAVVFLIGILCGYPTGAKVIADMYREKSLTKKEAERMLAFCNNSGPLFVIGTVGCLMLSDRKTGIVLYIIHVLSAVLCGVLLGVFSKEKTIQNEDEIIIVNFGEAVAKSVERAVLSILNVCGYVVFFACVTSLLNEYMHQPILLSLVEVTKGAKSITETKFSPEVILVLLSGAIGFGGVCVVLQVQSVAVSAGLSVKAYLLGKIFQMCISMTMTKVYLNLFGTVYAFAPVTQTRRIFQTVYVVIFLFLICGIFTMHRLTKRR